MKLFNLYNWVTLGMLVDLGNSLVGFGTEVEAMDLDSTLTLGVLGDSFRKLHESPTPRLDPTLLGG